MATASHFLAVANREIGNTEQPPNSNRQKYGDWYGWNGVPWCSIFVAYCADQVGLDVRKLVTKYYAGCDAAVGGYRSHGMWVEPRNLRRGDVVFYKFRHGVATADHTGIVESVTATGIVAIEGNTSGGDNTNGGAVQRRTRPWSVIIGGGRLPFAPDHPPIQVPPPSPTPNAAEQLRAIAAAIAVAKKQVLRYGDGFGNRKGQHVKVLQSLLNARGAHLIVDGEFGPATEKAVRWVQRAAHIGVDGVVGPQTWKVIWP